MNTSSALVVKTLFSACASLGLFLVMMAPASAAPGNDALMGYWKLDETADGTCGGGADVCDSSGDGHHGNFVGGMTASSALYPTIEDTFDFPNTYGYAFDGNDSISFGDVNDVGTGDFTLATWFKRGGTGTQYLISKSTLGGSGYSLRITAGGSLLMCLDFFCDFKGAGYIDNTWHHAAVTFDRDGVATFYVDGVGIGTTDISGIAGSLDNVAPLTFGSFSDTSSGFLNGAMDDVRMYSRVLSADEIADLAGGRHTAATWDGSTDSDYEDGTNWDIGATPDPYTNVIVPDVTNQPGLTVDTALVNLTISSFSANLDLNGFDLTVNDGGVFSNEGTLYLNGDEVLTGFTNDTNSGTISYIGTGTYTGLPAGNSYFKLDINGSGSWTLDAPINVESNIGVYLGTLSAGSHSIGVVGTWYRYDTATFNAGTGTVNLTGDDQSVTGSNTFYNLSKSVSEWTELRFETGKTQTITNNLTLDGTSDGMLQLLSSSLGDPWQIDATGATTNLEYAYVQDSTNIGTALTVENGFDGDRNVNWLFTDTVAPTITSLTLPANGTYGIGENLDFIVNYDEAIIVDTSGGTPRLVMIIGDAVYHSGSSTNALVFRYPVFNGFNYPGGATYPVLDLNGGTLQDGAGNNADLDILDIGDMSGVIVDTTEPTIQSFSPADNAIDVAIDTNFVMTFNELVGFDSGTITLKKASDDSTVVIIPVAVADFSDAELSVALLEDLEYETGYYIEITTTAINDVAGNNYVGIADSATWNFTTMSDPTPPSSGGSRGGGYAPGYGPNAESSATVGGGMTVEEMLALIARLQKQVAELRLLAGGAGALPDVVRDLELGSTGSDVLALQNILIGNGYTIPDGPTSYFGEQTRRALAAYQDLRGIVPAAGYFGPITRLQMKAAGLSGLWW